MTQYDKKAEAIISDCIRFVFDDVEPQSLALLTQVIKNKHRKDIEMLSKDLEEGIPAFMFKALLTQSLFDQVTAEYFGEKN